MSTTHEELVMAAKKAIARLFIDTTVPLETTIESLRDIAEDLAIQIDALERSKL